MTRRAVLCVGLVALVAAAVLAAALLLVEAGREAGAGADRAAAAAAGLQLRAGAVLAGRARAAAAAGRREAAARTRRGRARVRAGERAARRRAGSELRDLQARAGRAAASAAAARGRASERFDAARIVAIAGAGALALLAALLAVLLARAARRHARDPDVDAAVRALAASDALARSVAAELRPAGVHEAVLREVCDAAGADLGALYADGRLAAVRGLDRRRLPELVTSGEGLAGRALAERRQVVASPAEGGLRVRAFGREVPVRHELHLPLVRAGAPVGVLTLARLEDEPFSERDAELLDRLAPQAAVALAAVAAAPGRAREIDLVRLVREAVEAARPHAEEHGVEMALALEAVPPCEGDPERVQGELDETIATALRATGAGGRVEVRLSAREGSAVVDVAATTSRVELPLALRA